MPVINPISSKQELYRSAVRKDVSWNGFCPVRDIRLNGFSSVPACSAQLTTTSPRSEMRVGQRDPDVQHLPTRRVPLGPAVEVDDAVAFGGPSVRPGSCARTLDQDGLHGADAAGADLLDVLLQRCLDFLQATQLDLDAVSSGRLAAGVPGRGLKMKLKLLSADVVDPASSAWRSPGLAGKADDEVALLSDRSGGSRAACGWCLGIPSRCSRASMPSGCDRCRAAPVGAGG